MLSADDIIRKLDLKPLATEGGFYSETYRAGDIIPCQALPERYGKGKPICTAIYYLLTPETKSSLHRLATDEIYHFYLGDPVRMLLLYEDGHGETVTLGPDLEAGHRLQFVIPADTWQGSYLLEGGRFGLMGTTMSPGFDFDDYKPAGREELVGKFPVYADLIQKLL